jgi:hypothetical protein
VEIDGNKLVNKNGVIESQALPIEKIRPALAPYSDRSAGIVMINAHFGHDSDGSTRNVSDSTGNLLDAALEGIVRRAGFSFASRDSRNTSIRIEWKTSFERNRLNWLDRWDWSVQCRLASTSSRVRLSP